MLIRLGVRVGGTIHDTRVIMPLLNENEPTYALKHLATKYGRFFGIVVESYTFEECGDGSKYRKMMRVGLLAVMYGISTHSLA